MKPENFIKEVYRRIYLRTSTSQKPHYESLENFLNQEAAVLAEKTYRNILPTDKNSRILDIGFGTGWFMAACVRMGYTNVFGADFYAKKRTKKIRESCTSIKEVFEIQDTIGDFLSENDKKFDFIHMSHVIEHIPKYSLIYVCDSLYKALNKNGTLLLRTPNMQGPAAMSSYFVTLTHEYGFTVKNIRSLLYISGFDEIRFHRFNRSKNIKQFIGNLLRRILIIYMIIKNRLFGVGSNENYYSELIVSGRKKEFPELFNKKFK